MAIPTKDTDLVAYGANFAAQLTANPATYQTTPAIATAVTAANEAFLQAYNAVKESRENGTWSESLTAEKESQKLALLKICRPIYATVSASPTISDADKILLGVHIRDASPSPTPAPGYPPELTVTKIDGTVLTVRLRDVEAPASKGRPPSVEGAALFSFLGDEPPVDVSKYKFEGNTGKTTVIVAFPSSLPPGTKVFLLAFWFNSRKESGPACTPVGATLNYPASLPMAA